MGSKRWLPDLRAQVRVNAIRLAYTTPLEFELGARADDARMHRALYVGIQLMPSLTDSQILKVALGDATLRYNRGRWTFHEVPCQMCRGRGKLREGVIVTRGGRRKRTDVACPTCGGDGFSPPVK